MTMPNGQMPAGRLLLLVFMCRRDEEKCFSEKSHEVLELVLEMLVEAETLIVFQTYVKMCLRSDSTIAP